MLGFLASGESSGYDLARTADRSIAYMWAPSRSQIYKALPRLVALGLATSSRQWRAEPSDGQTVYDRIALAHGIAQARATLAWAEDARPQLEREARRRRAGSTTSR